jgi:uncharacterized membrane protein
MSFGSGPGSSAGQSRKHPGQVQRQPGKPHLRAIDGRPSAASASAFAEAGRDEAGPHFPVASGILLGLGIGGFFDGIVLHQLLQWHHLLSHAGVPADTVDGLRLNTLADGLFHATTYMFVVAGLVLFWRAARRPHQRWPAAELAATLLIGFGAFNLVEGLIDHQILGIHHVNETAPQDQWLAWDVAFLAWGAAMLAGGLWLLRRTRRVEDVRAGT